MLIYGATGIQGHRMVDGLIRIGAFVRLMNRTHRAPPHSHAGLDRDQP